MLYKIAHFFRDRMPWIWDCIEVLNSWLFSIRYGKALSRFKFADIPVGFKLLKLSDVPTESMVDFFANQPEEAFTFFRPHGFDSKSIKKLQRNRAFLAYVLIDKSNNKIAGYCFNRSFFIGKAYRGRMVDIKYRGRGLGTIMNRLLNEIGFGIGLRIFETVSKDNLASYRSAISASNLKIIEELPHNELYLEILPE